VSEKAGTSQNLNFDTPHLRLSAVEHLDRLGAGLLVFDRSGGKRLCRVKPFGQKAVTRKSYPRGRAAVDEQL
jgi:hypothetical protein